MKKIRALMLAAGLAAIAATAACNDGAPTETQVQEQTGPLLDGGVIGGGGGKSDTTKTGQTSSGSTP